MALIDTSFFYDELNIAQLSNVTTEVNSFIAKKEPEFLTKLMGESFYLLFKAGIEAAEPAGRWIELRDKLRNTVTKVSPIANYVFFYYTRNKTTIPTGTGEKKSKAANSEDVSPRYKLWKAWSDMVSMNKQIRNFLKTDGDYPEYTEPERTWGPNDDAKRDAYYSWLEMVEVVNPFI